MAGDRESGFGFIRERLYSGGDLSIRGDGRTVFGLACPFDETATVSDGGPSYRERFVFGAFSRTIRGGTGGRIKLLAQHDKKRFPIGRATMLREDRAGLVGEFRVAATRDGDEVLALISDHVLDAFSIGFSPVSHRRADDGVIERTSVALRETSIVAWPAYEGALIGGVRDLGDLDGDLDDIGDELHSASARRRRLLTLRTRRY